ncbi:YdgA family protein [Pseudocitrobacter corydidari]|uniref:Protein YdgA n=1 Tax=Pseudocitrobacter corydidari TaxID=2891570 RepID=A0ABY3SA99_9ENTR|nr:DUF945 family protein [Pseudocitrobacter corydidari]UGS42839.1 Protein YdgA [Pseudocitrobacter corydidari]
MKKFILFGGIIVALGVCWAGCSWYTGTQVGPVVTRLINEYNSSNTRSLKIVCKNFSGGVFTSHLQLVIFLNKKNNDPENSVVMDVNIAHGPFPFLSLKKGHFSPQRASIQAKFIEDISYNTSSENNRFFDLNIQSVIGYDKKMTTDINIFPGTLNLTTGSLSIGGGNITYLADLEGSDNDTLEGKIDKVILDLGNGSLFYLKDISLKATDHYYSEIVDSGHVDIEFNGIAKKDNGKEVLSADQIAASISLNQSKDKINSDLKLRYMVKNLKNEGRNIGSGEFSVNIGKLNVEILKKAVDKYNSDLDLLVAKESRIKGDPQGINKIISNIISTYVPLLQISEPTINVPVHWKNDKGDILANLDVSIADPQKTVTNDESITANIDRNLHNISLSMTVPINAAAQLDSQFKQAKGENKNNAEKYAHNDMVNIIMLANTYDLINVNDDIVTMQFQYSKGKVILNNKEISVADLLSKNH